MSHYKALYKSTYTLLYFAFLFSLLFTFLTFFIISTSFYIYAFRRLLKRLFLFQQSYPDIICDSSVS